MSRLTIRTEKGAVLKLDNPQNEAEAKKQLHDKYLIAVEKLAHYEDLEERGRLIDVVRCKDCRHEQYCKQAQYLGADGYCSKAEVQDE